MARPVVQDPGDQPSVARTSPLYCRYNGFLLGQFLSLAFAECGAPRYGDRRARLLEFLREVDVDVAIPESPLDRGGVTYAGVLSAILPRLAQRSRELAEFAILGGLLTHYAPGVPHRRRGGGGDAGRDRAPARRLRSAADRSGAFRRAGARSRPRSRPGAVARLPARHRRAPAGRERHGVRRHAVHGALCRLLRELLSAGPRALRLSRLPRLGRTGRRGSRRSPPRPHGQGRPDLGRRLGARSRRRLPDRRRAGARQAGRDRGVRGSRRRRPRPHRPRSGRPLRSARRGLAARHGAADVGVPGGDHAGGGARRSRCGSRRARSRASSTKSARRSAGSCCRGKRARRSGAAGGRWTRATSWPPKPASTRPAGSG